MRSCTLLLIVGVLAWSTAAIAEDAADASGAAGQPAVAGAASADANTVTPSDDAWAPGTAEAGTDPLAVDPAAPTSAPTSPATEPAAAAEAPPIDAAAQTPDVAWDVDETPMQPADLGSPATTTTRVSGLALGPEAIDEHGHRGRIHTVVKGDTLWDISDAYLGTPWVWPSIWQDNGEIENPHLIVPGDRVWVTAGEMRKVTHDEAAEMIAADNGTDAIEPAPSDLADTDEPAAPAMDEMPDEEALMADDAPAAMEQLPVAVPLQPAPSNDTGRSVRVAEREVMGFVTSEAIEAATSIVDSPSPRTWLVDGDMIYLGLGDGKAAVGDEFTIFRDAEPVQDIDGGRLLGYHVDILGWAVVREVDGETATAEIRMSHSEAHRGDRVIPRHTAQTVVPIKSTPEGIAGKIVFMPYARTRMGSGDYVYLNRGALHGFEVGSEVEVYTPGRIRKDTATGDRVMTPDRVDARMVLVDVKADTSVAYVLHTKRELEIGDLVRASASQVASR